MWGNQTSNTQQGALKRWDEEPSTLDAAIAAIAAIASHQFRPLAPLNTAD